MIFLKALFGSGIITPDPTTQVLAHSNLLFVVQKVRLSGTWTGKRLRSGCEKSRCPSTMRSCTNSTRQACADRQCCGSETGQIRNFAGSGVGSGINHFGSGSGQPISGMNLKQNFSDKIHNFSTRLCIHFPTRYHTEIEWITCSRITDFTLVHFLKNFIYRRNFTNTVRVCRATLSRRRPALPDPKQDPESEPKTSLKYGSGVGIRNESFRIDNPANRCRPWGRFWRACRPSPRTGPGSRTRPVGSSMITGNQGVTKRCRRLSS